MIIHDNHIGINREISWSNKNYYCY